MDKQIKEFIIKLLDSNINDVNIDRDNSGVLTISVGPETLYNSCIWNNKVMFEDGFITTVGAAKKSGKRPYAVEIPNSDGIFITLQATEERYAYEEALKINKNGWIIPQRDFVDRLTQEQIDVVNDCGDIFYRDYYDKAFDSVWIRNNEDETPCCWVISDNETYRNTHLGNIFSCRFVKKNKG